MKRSCRIAFLATALLGASVSAQPTLAHCFFKARIFSSSGSLNEFTQISYVETPGIGPGQGIKGSRVTAKLTGNFWILGEGDPDDFPTMGTDDGAPTTWGALENGIDILTGGTGWVINYASEGFPGAVIAGTWAQDPRIDGCPDLLLESLTCHAMFLADENGRDGFFAAMTERERSDGNYDFSRLEGLPLTLSFMPPPRITGSSRQGRDVSVAVGPPLMEDIAAAFYLDSTCGPVLAGYRLYLQVVPRGSPAPMVRERRAWQAATGPLPLDAAPRIVVDCSSTARQDVFLAQTFVFESGFELPYVSRQSTRIECGPNLAEPQEPLRRRPRREERRGRSWRDQADQPN
jgi:hypothetical protein